MNTYACKYCNKQWSTNQSRNGHQVHCPLNPKKKQIEQKIKQSNKGKSFNPISKHWVEKICPKCNKVYSVYITKESESLGRYKKFCSISCANSRKHSQQTKDKIGFSVKLAAEQKQDSVCERCGDSYLKSIITKNRRYCNKCIKQLHKPACKLKICQNCNIQFQTTNHLRNLCTSCINKRAYANGNNYVAGGRTKWIEVETSNGVIKVQGSYQQRMCRILDKMKELGDIQDWQYTNDRISYVGIDNKEHSYLLDFKVFHNDQSTRYIQTKGRVQQNDYCKWAATKQKGCNLQICFQKDIKDYEIKYNI